MHRFRIVMAALWLAALGNSAMVRAVTLSIDYTYDTTNFFGAGNPSGATAGAQARATLEAAADFYTDILEDTLSAIVTPQPFVSAAFGGVVTWEWTMQFQHPSDPNPNTKVSLVDEVISADEYRIYVGAESLSGNTIAFGGPGGFNGDVQITGNFSPTEIDQINLINDNFNTALTTRGEPSGFARWGGAITVDRDSSTNWHYNHNTLPAANKTDLFSVVLHEFAHTLGLGSSQNWNNWVTGTNFTGPNARDQNGGSVVPLACDDDGCAHWQNGLVSTAYLTGAPQGVLVGPSLPAGTRRLATLLDTAGLDDIGWDIATPPDPPMLLGDYNGNGKVDAADYAVWQDTRGSTGDLRADGSGNGVVDNADMTVWRTRFGNTLGTGTLAASSVPEPATALLWVAALLGLIGQSARRRNRA